jgi:hypothetical protein
MRGKTVDSMRVPEHFICAPSHRPFLCHESSLFGSRLIFGDHFPLLIALLRDARALYGKCVLDVAREKGSAIVQTAVPGLLVLRLEEDRAERRRQGI